MIDLDIEKLNKFIDWARSNPSGQSVALTPKSEMSEDATVAELARAEVEFQIRPLLMRDFFQENSGGSEWDILFPHAVLVDCAADAILFKMKFPEACA